MIHSRSGYQVENRRAPVNTGKKTGNYFFGVYSARRGETVSCLMEGIYSLHGQQCDSYSSCS